MSFLNSPPYLVRGFMVTVFGILLLGRADAATNLSLDLHRLPPATRQALEAKFPNLERSFSPQLSDEVINFLHQDPEIELVKIESSKEGPLSLNIQKSQIIKNLEFSGALSISKSTLSDQFSIREGDRFIQENLVDAAERLRNYYKTEGWLSPNIDLDIKQDSFGQALVDVKISEGPRTFVSEIVINSPNDKLNKELQKELRSYLKDPLSNSIFAEIQKNAREWLSENFYFRTELKSPSVSFSADETKARIEYTIDKFERYLIRFEGNKNESTSTLSDILELDTYFTSNPAIISDISNKVRQYYLTRGFARAEVNVVEVATKDPFTRRVEVRINEGVRIKLLDVKVAGRTSHSEKWYQNFIEEYSSELVQHGYYAKEDIDVGLKNLILQLQNEGHLTARLISQRVQYNDKKNGVTLFLNMDEGPITNVTDVQFEGNGSFSVEELAQLIDLKPKEPLRLDQIEIAIANLKRFYQDNGYIEMELLNEGKDLVNYSDNNTQAKLVFKIFEGPQVKIGAIAVEGNSFTRTQVVLNELDLEEGEVLTLGKIADATARLQRSGYFNSVDLKTLEEKTPVSHRTLIVKVSERNPGLWLVGMGANNERILTLRGYTGIAYRNLFGTGRGVSLRLEGRYNVADVKYFENTLTVGYLEPHFIGKRIRGRVNISRSLAITDYTLRKVTQTNQTTYSLEHDFNQHITGLYEVWSLATLRDFGIDDSRPVTESLLDIATTGPAVDIDYRDNPFNPTTGTLTRLKAEYSSPVIGSSRTIDYYKATGSFTHYLPIAKSGWVFANNLQAGYVKNLSNRDGGGVPYNKKGFILGGRSTVRGFESGTDEVFPNNADLGSDNYILTTAATMSLIKSELRFPFTESLAGALFYDGGSVFIQGLNLADSYRDSSGFGIRYNTPFGPLNLEFAWKLDARPSEEPWRFHLSIGTF